MKNAVITSIFLGLVSARPAVKREVPQEHSHEPILEGVRQSLNMNNPNEIGDPVFCLLGNAAAVNGLGKANKDPDCLQQVTKPITGSQTHTLT